MLCGCLLTTLQCITFLWLSGWQTCEGMDHSSRSNDERAGDEEVVDEEQVQEYLQGNTCLLCMAPEALLVIPASPGIHILNTFSMFVTHPALTSAQ